MNFFWLPLSNEQAHHFLFNTVEEIQNHVDSLAHTFWASTCILYLYTVIIGMDSESVIVEPGRSELDLSGLVTV